MGNIGLIAARELKAYSRSPLGYVAAAAALLIEGILFMALAMGAPGSSKLSANVLAEYFHNTSGVTMILAVALSMRVIAQEHESGTLVLLKTSPISDTQLVIGKYIATMLVLAVITLLTCYMPGLVYAYGRVSIGQILVGYCGLFLLAGVATAVGMFASALAKSQVIAAIVGAAIMGALVLMWLLARVSEAPIDDFIEGLAVHHLRFNDFKRGVLRLENVVFYIAMAFFFLLASIKTLEARRWR